jgi:hypothetical protein
MIGATCRLGIHIFKDDLIINCAVELDPRVQRKKDLDQEQDFCPRQLIADSL